MPVEATYSFPTTILFGAGAVSELRDRLSSLESSRPLVVTDPGLRATNAFRKTIDALPDATPVFANVHANPHDADVEAAREAFISNKCDGVIGIGGGSALDVAKIVRLRIARSGWRLNDEVPAGAIDDLAPFIAIPTTAGTGSEVGRSSVITIGGQKRVIFHPSLLADVVILDPVLTVDLPPKLTAATGADALTHCIESFTAPSFHPMCDGIALEGIHLIVDALPRAVTNGNDVDARGKMLIAAMMGAVAFQKDLGAAHALAHPLSAICNVHHGLANALMLPTVMKFNARAKPGVYVRIGRAMNVADPTDENTIGVVTKLLGEIGIPFGLRNHGVSESNLEALTTQAFADACHKTNVVPVTRDDLMQLYREAM